MNKTAKLEIGRLFQPPIVGQIGRETFFHAAQDVRVDGKSSPYPVGGATSGTASVCDQLVVVAGISASGSVTAPGLAIAA
jgi:hypothetical protein